jgi:alpha-galactosidase
MATPASDAVAVKIAYVVGGGRYWAPTLLSDLALTAQLTGELVLHDIDLAAAQQNVVLAEKLFKDKRAETSFCVRATASLADALKAADFVVLSIEPGPVTMFANDLDIPLKYGIIQTVGDTTGPGGLSRALRATPIYETFAREIMAQCPKAWVINYTNPMALCTAALYAAAPTIRALGCCHEVFHSKQSLAHIYHAATRKDEIRWKNIAVDVAGTNHFTFFTGARYQDVDLFPLVREQVQKPDVFRDHTAVALKNEATARFDSSPGLVQLDFFRRFGVFGAAGDRHLVEFVPWYLSSLDELRRWGVVVTPSSARLRTWRPAARHVVQVMAWWRKEEKRKRQQMLVRSDEEGVDIILALLGLGDLRTNVNFPNFGQIADLARGAVVETNAGIHHNSVRPQRANPLPAELNKLVERVVAVQQLTLKAARRKDRDWALEALLRDPLCSLSKDRAWEMLRELLRANRAMLAGWKID